MNDKEAFEAWAGKRASAPTTSAWDYAFRAWQEATKQERERCADICEQESTIEGVAQKCAAAIRADNV